MTFAGWPFVPVDSDANGYDQLTDELAATPPWDREYQRPSDFPTVAAFVEATRFSPSVAASSAAASPAVPERTRPGSSLDTPSRAALSSPRGAAVEAPDTSNARQSPGAA